MTTRQLPPQAIEAEMSILGAVFVDNDSIDTAHGIISAEDLYRESHRQIFKAMSSLADRNEPVDYVTLSAELKSAGKLDEIGGGAYLAVLADYVPMSANIAHYCKIVAQKSAERRLIQNAQDAVQIVYSGGDIAEAIQKLEKAIQPASLADSTHPVGMDRSIRESIARLQQRVATKGQIQGLPYGIHDLDVATSGMHPGEVIIIAGRPSMGKSALAGNIVANVCNTGKSALFFTLEMSRGDITDRLAAGKGTKYQNIRSGHLQDLDWMHLHNNMETMKEWKLSIDDTPAISLREIRQKARRMKKDGLDLIAVDYLQLMAMADPKANRVQGIGEISRGFKQLARELDVPIILLSQLSRAVDSRPDKRPMMSDLRDSGEIEQDADVIIFPYRPAAYCQQCKDRVDDPKHNFKEHQAKAEIIIEKQRAGERNLSIPVCWVGQHQRFDGVNEPCPY